MMIDDLIFINCLFMDNGIYVTMNNINLSRIRSVGKICCCREIKIITVKTNNKIIMYVIGLFMEN